MSQFEVTITQEQRDEFFEVLAKTGNASAAARDAMISRAMVYKLRKTDADFAARWEEAVQALPDRVLDAVIDEAVTGTPVLDEAGRVVGHRRNARLLDRLAVRVGVLDHERPTVAIQNNVTAPPAQVPRTIDEERERVLAGIKRDLLALRGAPEEGQFTDAEPQAGHSDPDGDLL